MGLNLIFVCTTIGALVGTSIGVLLLSRKIRMPITEADLAALRNKLTTAESSLAAATASVEDLQKQIAERDQTIQQSAADLKKKQEQFDLVLTDAEKDKAQRIAAEQRAQALSEQVAPLAEQRAALEAMLEEERRLTAERLSQMASTEAQHDAQKRQIQELAEQVDGLIAEAAALNRFREQESRHRSAVEAQLNIEQERVHQLTYRIAELEGERSQFDTRLQEERQSAARGMELLLMAQENFSRVLRPVSAANGNGNHGNGFAESAATGYETQSEDMERLQSALSANS